VLYGEQREGLRGDPVVRRRDRLVAICRVGRHHHVELKFAHRNQVGDTSPTFVLTLGIAQSWEFEKYWTVTP
jgi:hypothetical protein